MNWERYIPLFWENEIISLSHIIWHIRAYSFLWSISKTSINIDVIETEMNQLTIHFRNMRILGDLDIIIIIISSVIILSQTLIGFHSRKMEGEELEIKCIYISFDEWVLLSLSVEKYAVMGQERILLFTLIIDRSCNSRLISWWKCSCRDEINFPNQLLGGRRHGLLISKTSYYLIVVLHSRHLKKKNMLNFICWYIIASPYSTLQEN